MSATEIIESAKLIFSKQLFKSFSIYTLSSVICKAIPFLLIPVFTKHLTPEDYGVISIMLAGILAISPLLGPGVNELLTVEFQSFKKKELNQFVSTSIGFSILMFLFFIIFFYTLGDYLGSTLGIIKSVVIAIPIVALTSFSFELYLNILRNEDKPFAYAKLSIGRTIIEISLSTVLIVAYQFGYMGRVSGILISGIIFTLLFIVFLLKRDYLSLTFKKEYLKSILKFGLPTIPVFIMILILNNCDKYIVSKLLGMKEVGIYGIANQISVISNVALSSFLVPFTPYVYKQIALGTAPSKLQVVRASYLFLLFFTLINLIIYLLSPILFNYFIDIRYHEAIIYLPQLLLGQVFWALFMIVTAGYIYYFKKTRFYYFLSPVIIVFSFLTTTVLTEYFGLMGTSFAYLLSNFFLFILSLLFFKFTSFRLPWFKFQHILHGNSSKVI